GVLLGSFAALCAVWQRGSGQTLIDFALSVMNFAYAGLIGVFCTAFLTRRGNEVSGLLALVVGVVSVFILRFQATWIAWLPEGDWLVEHVAISYPWQLVISSSLAFLTCFLGAPRVGMAVPKALFRSQRP
ncbi:MAG: hypothetical protein KDA28_05515, partial [Phycisphaerales bacterium]|nr:hypothetical protein [Phycisphaerales bacterium]